MRIENEMLSRFNKSQEPELPVEDSLSNELEFFFDNVMDTVVDFFAERQELKV